MKRSLLVLFCTLFFLIGCTPLNLNKLTFTFSLEGIPKEDVAYYDISGRSNYGGSVSEKPEKNAVTFKYLSPGEWTFNISVRNKNGVSIGDTIHNTTVTHDSHLNFNVKIPLGVFRDFTAPNWSIGFARGSGLWETKEGKYIMTCFGNDNWGYSYYNADFRDHVLSVSLRCTYNLESDSYGYGIFFRSPEGSLDNCYQLSVTKEGKWCLTKNQNGVRTTLNSAGDWDDIPNSSPPSTLKVECRGDEFTVFIDNYSLETITDSTFSKGKAGLCGYDHIEFDWIQAYQFDSFRISI